MERNKLYTVTKASSDNVIIARPENNAKKAVRQGANYKERI